MDGFDSMDAKCNALAVEAKPAEAGNAEEDKPAVAGKFHKEFADKVKLDPDMAERGIKG